NATCSTPANVTGTSARVKNNTTSTSSSNEGGPGAAASASVTVLAPPVIAKAFNPQSIPLNGTSTLTFTLSNPNNAAGTPALTNVSFSDTLPAGEQYVGGLTST